LGFPYNIFTTAGASDCKFGMQLGFATAHHKLTRRRKGTHGPGLRELLDIWGFAFNIYTMAEASNFRFGIVWACQGPPYNHIHGKKWGWLWANGAPQNFGVPYNISATAGGRDFKFGTQLGFAKAHHKPHLEEKWAWLWVREAPKYLGFPFNISATVALFS